MKIHFLECTNCHGYVFSFSQHDYKSCGCGKISLDGGFDYTKISSEHHTDYILKNEEIKDLIMVIREKFFWTKTMDKDGNFLDKPERSVLSSLKTSHIMGILKYFTDREQKEYEARESLMAESGITYENEYRRFSKEWLTIHSIFIEELIYRYENKSLL